MVYSVLNVIGHRARTCASAESLAEISERLSARAAQVEDFDPGRAARLRALAGDLEHLARLIAAPEERAEMLPEDRAELVIAIASSESDGSAAPNAEQERERERLAKRTAEQKAARDRELREGGARIMKFCEDRERERERDPAKRRAHRELMRRVERYAGPSRFSHAAAKVALWRAAQVRSCHSRPRERRPGTARVRGSRRGTRGATGSGSRAGPGKSGGSDPDDDVGHRRRVRRVIARPGGGR